MTNLDTFVSHSKQLPSPISTSQQVRDRGSIFEASIYPADTVTIARATVNHVKYVSHASHPATHEMSAWRCMMIKSGLTGLGGEDDFEVASGFMDDGEEFGGRRVLKIMLEENVLDAVVVVSRW